MSVWMDPAAARIGALTAERGRARDVAAILEAQVARVAELHCSTTCAALQNCCPCCECNGPDGAQCAACRMPWPCDTARAIGIERAESLGLPVEHRSVLDS